jgi:hypothetical protein
MSTDESYWTLLKPNWETIDIYQGPETFLRTLSEVRREVGLLFAAHWCKYEVCNGGLRQFFGNSTGVLAPEAVEGFRALEQTQIAELVTEAMGLLGQPYERERRRRNDLLDLLPDDTYDRIARPFGDLNQKFYGLIRSEAGGFEAAANRYAKSIAL